MQVRSPPWDDAESKREQEEELRAGKEPMKNAFPCSAPRRRSTNRRESPPRGPPAGEAYSVKRGEANAKECGIRSRLFCFET